MELSTIPIEGVLLSREWLNNYRKSHPDEEIDFSSDRQVCNKTIHDGYKIIYTPHSKVYYLQ
ncbi:hypothetical protein D3C85_1886550 [compost metagenome]